MKQSKKQLRDAPQRAKGLVGSVLGRIGRRLESRDTINERQRQGIVTRLFHEGGRRRPFRRRFMLMMCLSTAIAGLGLLSDSTAVVIGAMLVAPMMEPVLSVAAAIVMAWPRRVLHQAGIVLLRSVAAVFLALGIALIVPWQREPLPAEILARTSPNLLDLGIALAAGAAGAYAQIRKQVSDALIGVAVAVALVPPLAVVGIATSLAEWQFALGALLLFLVNVCGIVLSAGLMFLVSGFVPGRRLLTGNASIAAGVRWATVAVLLIVIPMQFGRGSVLAAADPTSEVAAVVEKYLTEHVDAAELVGVSVEVIDDVTEVDVVVATSQRAPEVTELASLLAERLETTVHVNLQVVESEIEQATVTGP